MSRTPSIINFATTADQSMWGTGAASGIHKEFFIIPSTTISGSVNQTVGPVSLQATASGTFDLKATLDASAGAVSVKYPVNAYIDLPNSVEAGDAFTVGTKFFSTSAPDLKTTFPGLTFS